LKSYFFIGCRRPFGLVGKNGAGKSTMLKMLAGDFSTVQAVFLKEKNSYGLLRQRYDFEQEEHYSFERGLYEALSE
jgi:ATPase subunit of ABC transporter with duplicated ATPase domains